MSFKRCSECRELYWPTNPLTGNGGRHVCAPHWHVWCSSHHGELGTNRAGMIDEASLVRANDPEDAATAWAQESDSNGDYTIIGSNGEDFLVWVAPLQESGDYGPEGQWFKVRGERVPEYIADETEAPAGQEPGPTP